MAWAIEQKLVTTAECRAALAHSTPKAVWLLSTRFSAAVTRMVERHLGPIRSKHGQQWYLADDLTSLHSQHYIAFDRSKLVRCTPATSRLAEKLLKHRRMHFAAPQDLLAMSSPNGDVAYAIEDFDPKNPYESWKRYLQNELTEWEFHDGGDAPEHVEDPYALAYDYCFGSYDHYLNALTAITSKPPRRRPLSPSRDAKVQQFVTRAIALLDSIRCDRYFSLADESSHPSEAAVVASQPKAFDVAQNHFDRVAESGETPGVQLGIQPGAGKKPLHVALHAIASSLILEALEELL